MTLPAGSNAADNDKKPEDAGHDQAGNSNAIEPSHAGSAADASLAPFLEAAGERIEMPAGPRPLYSKVLDYSAHAAMIAGLLGFAWTLSDHVGRRPDDKPVAKVAVIAPVSAAPADLDWAAGTQKLTADINALRLSLEAMRGTMRQDSARQDKTNEQMHALVANLDSLKAGLTATKAETNATLAQLSVKMDHLPHADPSTKIQQVVDRLDKMEHQSADPMTTASIAPQAPASKPVAVPPSRPQVLKAAAEPESSKKAPVAEAEAPKKPQIIAEWVVRDVYNGVAVVESKRGPMEVVPGVAIPGAGVVKSIDRHGSGWTVTTSKGQIAFVPLPRDRSPRNYYRDAPEDF